MVTFPNHTAKERSEKHQNPGNPKIQSNVFPVDLLNFSFAGKNLDRNRTDHTKVDVMTDWSSLGMTRIPFIPQAGAQDRNVFF